MPELNMTFNKRRNQNCRFIFGFHNEHFFLSNFKKCKVTLPAEGNLPEMDFDAVENAYMAWKTVDLEERLKIQKMSAEEAKNYSIAGNITLREDYSNEGRLQIMEILINQKYSDKNPELMAKLIAIGDVPIIEANDWGDVFFGFCVVKGYGENHLGRLIKQRQLQLL